MPTLLKLGILENQKHKYIINPHVFITQVQQLSACSQLSFIWIFSHIVLNNISDILSLSLSILDQLE